LPWSAASPGNSDCAGIDHSANPFAEIVNELAVTAVHVEAAYSVAKPSGLMKLVGPDILKTQIGFILGASFCATATTVDSTTNTMIVKYCFILTPLKNRQSQLCLCWQILFWEDTDLTPIAPINGA
jgi:hypothetical protein